MDAIRNVLETIRQNLNEYLQNTDQRPGDWVTLTSVVGHDGRLNEGATDKIVMCLYNITHETTISTFTATQQSDGKYFQVSPPLYIDLHVIFMANFFEKQYSTGLAAISRVISYFQQNPWLSHATAPKLDPTVDKIILEFTTMTPVEVNYVMGMLGTKYLPSVFYKLRMIPFVSKAMQAQAYPAAGGDIVEGRGGSH